MLLGFCQRLQKQGHEGEAQAMLFLPGSRPKLDSSNLLREEGSAVATVDQAQSQLRTMKNSLTWRQASSRSPPDQSTGGCRNSGTCASYGQPVGLGRMEGARHLRELGVPLHGNYPKEHDSVVVSIGRVPLWPLLLLEVGAAYATCLGHSSRAPYYSYYIVSFPVSCH